MLDLLRRGGEKTYVLGHRGAMGHAPENTFASFRKAVELGADMIELDVHLSRDGEAIVIHDEKVDRTTGGGGYVKDLTAAELREFDAGAWYGEAFRGERIPLLRDVLAWARGKIPLCIEIKNGPLFYEGIEQTVLALLKEANMVGDVIVISFDHESVRRVKAQNGKVKTGILYSCRFADPVGVARLARADALHPRWTYLTPEEVETAHAAGIAVNPWVANEPPLMGRLVCMGADMIGTNYPDRLRKHLEE